VYYVRAWGPYDTTRVDCGAVTCSLPCAPVACRTTTGRRPKTSDGHNRGRAFRGLRPACARRPVGPAVSLVKQQHSRSNYSRSKDSGDDSPGPPPGRWPATLPASVRPPASVARARPRRRVGRGGGAPCPCHCQPERRRGAKG